MYALRGQTMRNFGVDNKASTLYRFNSLGYRSPIEFESDRSPIIILGNTISFGIGLDYQDTFAGIVANSQNHPVYNFSWGCYAHTNAEQLELLKKILLVLSPSRVIFQINNLNRRRVDGVVSFDNPANIVVEEFNNFFTEIQQVLSLIPHDFLHWDEHSYSVNLPKCLIHNKYHVDSSLSDNPDTFGVRSHKLIAHAILTKEMP